MATRRSTRQRKMKSEHLVVATVVDPPVPDEVAVKQPQTIEDIEQESLDDMPELLDFSSGDDSDDINLADIHNRKEAFDKHLASEEKKELSSFDPASCMPPMPSSVLAPVNTAVPPSKTVDVPLIEKNKAQEVPVLQMNHLLAHRLCQFLATTSKLSGVTRNDVEFSLNLGSALSAYLMKIGVDTAAKPA